MTNEPDCYGTIFPSVGSLVENKEISGKVFGYEVVRTGIAITRRAVIAPREAWRRCMECPHFDGCFRRSAGTVLRELAIRP